ncbi:MAG: glycogen debranching N-terminal domain-containing protein [Bacillota bacterium]|nr:glycogen debranching N-terminal domain-containing protein [Bacillota bacterium]
MSEARVIKEQGIFLVTDDAGDVRDDVPNAFTGLFFCDTRFLSKWEFTLNGVRPLLLSSDTDRPYLHDIWLTNPEFAVGKHSVPRERLCIHRQVVVDGGVLERVVITNYHRSAVQLRLVWRFAGDFRDVFELREVPGPRGTELETVKGQDSLTLRYMGIDNIERQLLINGRPTPTVLHEGCLVYEICLPPAATETVEVSATPAVISPAVARTPAARCPQMSLVQARPIRTPARDVRTKLFSVSEGHLAEDYSAWEDACTTITTDNHAINSVLGRSLADLRLLAVHTEYGPYLVAGLPKFGTLFGRDSILAAVQTLMLNNDLAKGTLRCLALLQGREVNPWRDEQPGKILHEVRHGELAHLGLIPFGRYYGSIDSTPLFVILLAETYKWTGDTLLLQDLAQSLDRAVAWLDEYGDPDSDGYLEYSRMAADGTLQQGLTNQGWKDSNESLVFPDGSLARGPAALVEVQAYAYAAKLGAADLYETLGNREKATFMRTKAAVLRERFNRDFWVDKSGFFALALDGNKQQVDTLTSNPGHGLWAGIIDEDRVSTFAERLLSSEILSSWGLRTLAAGQAAYNPVSYHNGAIWPHDNSIIASGLKRYGLDTAATSVAVRILRAATCFPGCRLPELYCGHDSRRPVAYPDACSPQAWAAGAVFMAFQTILGLFAANAGRTLYIRPCLPPEINVVEVKHLSIGGGRLDLVIKRQGTKYNVTVGRNDAGIELIADGDCELTGIPRCDVGIG